MVIKNCGLEPGSQNGAEGGVCPAAMEKEYNGINQGKNGGRSCWLVEGTLCDIILKGTHASKDKVCSVCEFYKLIQKEEGSDFIIFYK